MAVTDSLQFADKTYEVSVFNWFVGMNFKGSIKMEEAIFFVVVHRENTCKDHNQQVSLT